MMLHGNFESAYTDGNNETVVPTETQKNTIYAMSKKYPIDPLERWVVLAARDLMGRHSHVQAVDMEFVRLPWDRIEVQGKPHKHAFVKGAGSRFVKAHVTQAGGVSITAGFQGLRVMKTAQSGFEGFIVDQYTTLKPTRGRVMATEIYCEYKFAADTSIESTPFADIAAAVKQMTLEGFSGPADTGKYSASVQKTLHEIGTSVLARFPLVASIKFALPNIHFYPVDFDTFRTNLTNNGEVFFTFDGAHGMIEAEIVRKRSSKL
jgi:urate oxidase